MAGLAWVTGAGGLIGSHLVRSASQHAPSWKVRPLTREDFDLLDSASVRQAYRIDRPDLIIHCAALSRSPVCQKNPELAWRANVEATRILCELAAETQFVFFSSDLVFDGQTGSYREDAPVHPLSVYGETKVAAEKLVLANPKHTVIRTSLNGGVSPTGDRGFNEQLRVAWTKGEICRLFTDEFRSPLPAQLTARAVWELANQRQCGLFHVAGTKRLSRWEIGQLIAARWPKLRPQIQPTSAKDYPGAPRPPDTSLNCAKVQQFLSFRLPGLDEWLAEQPPNEF